MQDPFPPLDERCQRVRAVQRLRSAVDAAIRDGRLACRHGSEAARMAEPLLNRLQQIGRELDRMEGLRSGWAKEESHPFWTDLLSDAAAQTPCGRSPPPENGSR